MNPDEIKDVLLTILKVIKNTMVPQDSEVRVAAVFMYANP